MKRMVFKSVAKLVADDPIEVFWLAGLVCNERNEWKVRTVYRNKRTGEIISSLEPIGMLPLLTLGTWFNFGELKTDNLPGEQVETIVPDVGRPEIITSADLPLELYPLPMGKAGNQRLFRYRTVKGDVLIPAIELVRVLFVRNRALALAMMRPAGLEQLYVPMELGQQDKVKLQFTKEMPKSAIGRDLAMNFAWIILDRDARKSWDSVLRNTTGQSYVLFDPPPIRNSIWAFRGIHHGNLWLVLELQSIQGRRLPVRTLEYGHPAFLKTISVGKGDGSDSGSRGSSSGEGKERPPEKEYDVDDGEGGSGSYRGAKTVDILSRRSAFENKVKVVKVKKEVERRRKKKEEGGKKPPRAKDSRVSQVTTGERASGGRLPPLEFKAISSVPLASMGDLEALDETVRHMRDTLPNVEFFMGLAALKQGPAVASVGSSPRVAMVVTIRPSGRPPIILIDIERSGIAALSMMSMHFAEELPEDKIEAAVQKMLDGWAKAGGYWSSEVESALAKYCRCQRLPKVLIPRGGSATYGKGWAMRLTRKLGLEVMDD